MNVKAFVGAAALSLAASGASAVTTVETGSTGPSTTPFSAAIGIDTFDTSLGTLVSATVEVFTRVTSTFDVENLTGVSQNLDITTQGAVDFGTAGLGDLGTTDATSAGFISTLAFDGTIDFGGQSGSSGNALTALGIESITLTGADLAEFLGDGISTVDILVDAISLSSVTGTGFASIVDTEAEVFVTVTYDFDVDGVVPLPGSMALLLGGLGAAGLMIGRRKAAA